MKKQILLTIAVIVAAIVFTMSYKIGLYEINQQYVILSSQQFDDDAVYVIMKSKNTIFTFVTLFYGLLMSGLALSMFFIWGSKKTTK